LVDFCFECTEFPCELIKKIAKGYEENYKVNMVENLSFIKEYGIDKFLEKQKEKWKCPDCGELISCHNGICYGCGLEKLRAKKNKYRWED
jgi:hypothetical protein